MSLFYFSRSTSGCNIEAQLDRYRAEDGQPPVGYIVICADLNGLNYVATGGTRFEAVQRGNDALIHRVILILVRKITSSVLSNAER
jgi:hypothetical protein